MTQSARDALYTEIQTAHRHVQRAQDIAYGSLGWKAPLRTRLALNRAQTILIRLAVHLATREHR